MAYVITAGCCSDASCIAVCPVNCIHPTPDEPDFGTTATLFVNPATCIDCGACADACPVDAISPQDLLSGPDAAFVDRNRDFYRDRPEAVGTTHFPVPLPHGQRTLHVAVVGTGPAAYYTADLLLRTVGADVTMIDRLPVPGGLLRYGVAPDHPATKLLGERFTGFLTNPKLHMLLGVEVGTDVFVDELSAHFDAVVYAVGASAGRALDIPGEQLPGSTSATEFVNWYNAHPDSVEPFGLHDPRGARAVVIGNGNVAVDVARVALSDPDRLATTDIADAALAALRTSTVREVVICGRRGPEDAAYTMGELHALKHLPDIDLVVADSPGLAEHIAGAAPGSHAAFLADVAILTQQQLDEPTDRRRIVLRFHVTAREIHGSGAVESITLDGPGGPLELRTALVIRAIGYRGNPVGGLPFDDRTHTVPHRHGRVVDEDGLVQAGRYVVGWIKRGASGGIGANRQDATETVASLVDDIVAGMLPRPSGSARVLRMQVARRLRTTVDRQGVRAIDAYERGLGEAAGRPRVKLSTRPELLAAARRGRR